MQGLHSQVYGYSSRHEVWIRRRGYYCTGRPDPRAARRVAPHLPAQMRRTAATMRVNVAFSALLILQGMMPGGGEPYQFIPASDQEAGPDPMGTTSGGTAATMTATTNGAYLHGHGAHDAHSTDAGPLGGARGGPILGHTSKHGQIKVKRVPNAARAGGGRAIRALELKRAEAVRRQAALETVTLNGNELVSYGGRSVSSAYDWKAILFSQMEGAYEHGTLYTDSPPRGVIPH